MLGNTKHPLLSEKILIQKYFVLLDWQENRSQRAAGDFNKIFTDWILNI